MLHIFLFLTLIFVIYCDEVHFLVVLGNWHVAVLSVLHGLQADAFGF